MHTTPLALLALTGTTLGACITRSTIPNAQSGPLTAATLTTIDPKTASCAGAAFKEECRTAEQAVDPINKSFEKYGLTTKGEQAAVVALMLFESGSFQFNKNHYPAPGTYIYSPEPFLTRLFFSFPFPPLHILPFRQNKY
jgi:hypothetical protein